MNRKTIKGFTEPMRTCVGCRKVKPKSELLRIALSDGKPVADIDGKAPGRGIYVCKDKACVAEAFDNRGINRGFRRGFDKSATDALRREIEESLEAAR